MSNYKLLREPLLLVSIVLIIAVLALCLYISILWRELDNLKHERNLTEQSFSKMRLEYEEKERIYKAQEEQLKRLEEAETLEDYIRIWQELSEK